MISRAYRPQRGRGHITAIALCVPSKIQIRQWFVTNYSNSCCLGCTMHTVDTTIFSPLGVYKLLMISCTPHLIHVVMIFHQILVPEMKHCYITHNPLPPNVPSPTFKWFFGPYGNASLPSGLTSSYSNCFEQQHFQ